MEKLYLTVGMLTFSAFAFSQTTITLVNSPTDDLDALVSSKTNVNEEDINYQGSPDIGCGTWSYSGAGEGKNRSFLNFDWTQIPSNATILSAELDLYSLNMGWIIHGGHSGANESWLKRVVDEWDPAAVTWNNQPSTANTGAVTLKKSNSSNEDYLKINVTDLIQGMKTHNGWYGFAFISKDEEQWGVLSFVSSNSSDSAKRPHLRITFSVPTSNETNLKHLPKVLIYPNPSANPTIAVSGFEGQADLQLFNVTGQKIGYLLNMREAGNLQLIDFTGGENLTKGIYVIRIKTAESDFSGKIVIQ